MKELKLDEKVDWKKLKEEDLFFQPQVDDLRIKDHYTGWKSIYRQLENGDIDPIGMRSKNYQIVENKEIHDVVKGFDDFPLELDYTKSTNNRNSKFQLVYNIADKYILDDEEDGGKLVPNLVVVNSYDGTKRLKLEFGFFRMICANMHIIPVSEQSFVLSEKHYKGNFQDELVDIIYPWLNNVINEKVFDDIRNYINWMKGYKEVFLPYEFFNLISLSDAIVFIKLIERFSKIDVRIKSFFIDRRYDNNNLTSFIQELIERKHADKQMEKNWDIEARLAKLNEVCYNEKVNSQWMFYCMMIKISQFLVNKERRLDYSQKISSLFFGSK